MARLYEYQSKKLLREGGIRVPDGSVAFSPEEARAIAERIGKPVVLKIQVWLTGRAGMGGIQFADNPGQAEDKARQMLGMKVKNYVVDRILVEERLNIKSEFFTGLVMDDARKCPLLVFSSAGGTGIEEIARRNPEKISRLAVDVGEGVAEFEARNLVRKAGLAGSAMLQLADLLTKLYKVARAYDARSAEINPLVLTADESVYAAD
jgi:succinyl-CoA synthetase beta subunit